MVFRVSESAAFIFKGVDPSNVEGVRPVISLHKGRCGPARHVNGIRPVLIRHPLFLLSARPSNNHNKTFVDILTPCLDHTLPTMRQWP